MYQIDSPQAVATIQAPAAPGTPGNFQDTSNPGTVVNADWANTVMWEILNVLVAADVAPEKPTTTASNDPGRKQLAVAIAILIADAIAAIPAAPGYPNIPQVEKGANYETVLADRWTNLFFTGNFNGTIAPHASVAYNPGDFIVFTWPAGSSGTVSATETIRDPIGNTEGALTVTGPGRVVMEYQSNGEWWVVGGFNYHT